MFNRLPTLLILVCLAAPVAASFAAPSAAEAQPSVLSTIKPLQLIAGAVTDGISEPALLIPEHESYHHFTLRPSSMRALTAADLVIWVGPELETYLADAVRQMDSIDGERVITVSQLPDITRHSPVSKALIQSDGDSRHAHKQSHDAGSSDSYDPHLWLNTGNALVMATTMAEKLAELDPDNAVRYQDNLARFTDRIGQWQQEAGERMAALESRDYAVYHSAFQYFEREHDLAPRLVFVQDDEMQPGMRQLLSVRRALETESLSCLLEDSTANPNTIRTALGNIDLRRVQADSMGAGLSPDADAYIEMMRRLVRAFEACLQD